jgi:hypothetical protein
VNLARIEGKLIILSKEIGVPVYDFNFDLHFSCDHPYQLEHEELCVLRVGPVEDYDAEFNDKLAMGLRLVNTPAEHTLASELERWYPIIKDLTPRTVVFDTLPTVEEIESHFSWPIFLKGSRQTSKHNADLSVIHSRAQYESAAQQYRRDSILHWQKPVIREVTPLVTVAGEIPGKIQPSLECRSFWWHGVCVGWGRYWYAVAPYECGDAETGLAVAQQAATRLRVPFLVIDFAKTADGRWIVIECNDAQESGYAAVQPQLLWKQILTQIDRGTPVFAT